MLTMLSASRAARSLRRNAGGVPASRATRKRVPTWTPSAPSASAAATPRPSAIAPAATSGTSTRRRAEGRSAARPTSGGTSPLASASVERWAAGLGSLGHDHVRAGGGAAGEVLGRGGHRQQRQAGRAGQGHDRGRVAQADAEDGRALVDRGLQELLRAACPARCDRVRPVAAPQVVRPRPAAPAGRPCAGWDAASSTLTPTGRSVSSRARRTAARSASTDIPFGPEEPRPPASETAATSSGVEKPPAIGASSTGWRIPSRSQSGVCSGPRSITRRS